MNQHRFLLLHDISPSRPQSYTLNSKGGSVSLTLAQRAHGSGGGFVVIYGSNGVEADTGSWSSEGSAGILHGTRRNQPTVLGVWAEARGWLLH